jgi:hypothetical protein
LGNFENWCKNIGLHWIDAITRSILSRSAGKLPDLYNFNDPDYSPRLTFTTDRSQFPALDGIQPEAMFGPDVNIIQVIYSQGWGQDGQGGALIFITGDPDGGYTWYGMGYSSDNFSH